MRNDSVAPSPSGRQGIILAADVSTLGELERLAELAAGARAEVTAIKLGFQLALRHGLRTLTDRVKSVLDISLIYDHQKAGTDIPAMGVPFAEVCKESGIDSVIIFPHAGPSTLEAFVRAAFQQALSPIVGLVMSHDAYLQSEGGFLADDSPARICRAALDLGVTRFVLPGTKPSIIREFATKHLSTVRPVDILMPGIGTQGGAIETAFAAVGRHSPFAIVGSSIYRAADPVAALQEFIGKLPK